MKIDKNKKILIVGLGLIGGSYASCLKDANYQVYALSKEKKDIEYGIKHNIILGGQTRVSKKFINQFDIIIFALYPKVFISWIEKYHNYFKKGTIITDVTGIKKEVVYKVNSYLNKDIDFVPAHPMAGKEVYGVKNSNKDLFKNANLIITPLKSNKKESIETIIEIGNILQFSNISIISIKRHDEMIAFLSQLTHCLAVSLMTCKKSHHLKDYTGDSFKDLTRIASINEKMWIELFLMNKQELIKQMNLFLNEFSKLKNAIENEDIKTMYKMMKLSTKRRKYFDK